MHLLYDSRPNFTSILIRTTKRNPELYNQSRQPMSRSLLSKSISNIHTFIFPFLSSQTRSTLHDALHQSLQNIKNQTRHVYLPITFKSASLCPIIISKPSPFSSGTSAIRIRTHRNASLKIALAGFMRSNTATISARTRIHDSVLCAAAVVRCLSVVVECPVEVVWG